MNIDEAIELLSEWLKHPPGVVFSSEIPAVQLGIEALKRLQVIRGYPHNQWKQLVPGETTQKG